MECILLFIFIIKLKGWETYLLYDAFKKTILNYITKKIDLKTLGITYIKFVLMTTVIACFKF